MEATGGIVPGGPGLASLRAVGSAGGLSVHLLDPVTDVVLCEALRDNGSVFVDPELSPRFDDVGCRRCAEVASERGYTTLTDFDLGEVRLPGFVPAWDRREPATLGG